MLRQAHFAFSYADREYRGAKLKGELIVDCFAGGGGASLGIERACGRPVDIAINHDRPAIDCHQHNHPETWHYCEDVFQVDPVEACAGKNVGLAWFSPDCTHFSRAKGGRPRSQGIRGLAWVVIRWAQRVRPRVIILENVREFAEWGPLLPDGRPDPAKNGLTFRQWLGRLRGLGYNVEAQVLNAADYGAPTHRKRLFIVARLDRRPIKWPEPTHGPGRATPWRMAAEIIDWSIPCPSIFISKEEAKALGFRVQRPLRPKSLDRIGKGIVRFVMENPQPFIIRANHGSEHWRGQKIDAPLATVTGSNGWALTCPYMVPRFGEAPGQSPRTHSVEEPIPTVTARAGGGFNLVASSLVSFRGNQSGRDVERPMPTVTANSNDGNDGGAPPIGMAVAHLTHFHGDKEGENHGRGSSPDDPLPTQDTSNRFGLVAACIAKNYTGVVGSRIDEPLSTVTGVDHNAVVAASLSSFYGESIGSAADQPVPTVTSNIHESVVAANLISNTHGDKQWFDAEEPLRTVRAGGTHHALVQSKVIGGRAEEVAAFVSKYYGTNVGSNLDEPLHTVTAKPRFALITVGRQQFVIDDIGMRMLIARELARAQGFPDSYVLEGSSAQQVKLIGNSVCPDVAEAIVRANI